MGSGEALYRLPPLPELDSTASSEALVSQAFYAIVWSVFESRHPDIFESLVVAATKLPTDIFSLYQINHALNFLFIKWMKIQDKLKGRDRSEWLF